MSTRAPGERWYRRLLHLYPPAFRGRYEEEMVAFYRDRWREARAGGRAGAAATWLLLLGDLAATAMRVHADGWRARQHATPTAGPEGSMLDSLRQDLRYALGGMRRRPGFTAVVVVTLALGIGANTAIYSVVQAVLLRPLPFADPDRLVMLSHEDPYYTVSEPEFVDYRRDARSFRGLAAFADGEGNLTGTDEPERVQAARVSDGFFATLGVTAARGRVFTADEERPGAPAVVVLSDGLWRRRFNADPALVGRTIQLNGRPRTVVGIMPAHFDFPSARTAVWAPLRLDTDSLWTRNNHYLTAVGRLAPGATTRSAAAELGTMTRRWARDYPETYFPDKPLVPSVKPMADALVGPTRPYLFALLGAVGFVLLIACVNVANLLLTRGEARRKELAIRTALGASGGRLVRQALTESALLALVGAGLGLLLAAAGGGALLAVAPPSIPRLDAVRIDLPVLAFTLVVALGTGLLFGLAPAVGAARGQSAALLKEGGKTSYTGGGGRRTRGALVVAEVALAVVMLAGAGLMLRSLAKLRAIDLGFTPAGVLTARLSLPAAEYDDARAAEFASALAARAAAIPGVTRAAATGWVPIDDQGGDGESSWSIMLDGRTVRSISEAPAATPAQITPAYFQVMGIAVVRGRAFTDADRADAPPVAVVNETMARKLWPGQDAVGHTLKMFDDDAPWVRVVGVVRDVRSRGFLGDVPMTMYFPYAQAGRTASYAPRSLTLVVRAAGDPGQLAAPVRREIRALERNAPISSVRTMDDVVSNSIASRRFSTTLLGGFAALALALAGLGIYGVVAFAVSQRSFELGLRMALGARPGAVVRLVIAQGVRMTVVGLAVGLAGALVVGRLGRSLLVGVEPVDAPTLAAVALALAGVALLASALPARRATRVSPTETLRGG